ncbi:MAG TPA: NAD(P)-dependent methylenetetrahydromethanopterin dehydrogenase [Alphaproteobacteria bacterium]|nr:NAD(P)-dependent methylenetetrahydromethanopterin dehydrogenase [Alphaproteobacteria bacterium]
MERPAILHMISPQKHVSPFDLNMAADAGFEVIATYGEVDLAEVAGLVQDMIFSRAPKDSRRTALFIGGRDAGLALDMLAKAKKAMMPPFAISAFADPSGSFTTAAAMMALIEKELREEGGLRGRSVTVFGAGGTVGIAAAALAAQAEAKVTLASHRGRLAAEQRAGELETRFGVEVVPVDGSSSQAKSAAIRDAEIVIAAGPAGVRILGREELSGARALKLAADVNAVPPAGIEGLGPSDMAKPIAGGRAVGFGPLAIGNIKFKTQNKLLRMMLESDQPLVLEFQEAYRVARAIAG